MTKQQYNKLQQYEEQFRTAVIGSYVRKLYKPNLTELDKIYMEIFKSDSKLLSGCPKCILTAMKKLGTEYFNYQNKLKEKENKDDGRKE